ncbi:hypothetical protein [Oceanobacillus timonensis]|uniref:hypothetical protein n=1 Tax=Oceanobacillus timonensis TaxID=1926285 RepID=UPI0009BAE951|nr:hypothetical protein [Oceanobacillus timonensis]
MKKHTKLGKRIFWAGFLFTMLGIAFNKSIGTITDGPEILSTFSVPSIIIGIIIVITSNFFTNKKV